MNYKKAVEKVMRFLKENKNINKALELFTEEITRLKAEKEKGAA